MRASQLLLGIILGLMIGCSDKDDEDKGGSDGDDPRPYAATVVTSNALGLVTVAESCAMYGDGIDRADGTCFTPVSVTGFAHQVNFGSDENDPHLRGGVRVFSEDEKTELPGEIMPGGEFDLADPSKNLVGNNTFAGPTSNETPSHYKSPQMTWTYANINLWYLQFKVALKDKFVTVLLPSYSQPVSAAANFSKCTETPSESERNQERFTSANLLADMEFSAGDYLFCVKETEAEACSAEDFKWLNASHTLVSSRPSSPKHASSLMGSPACEVDEERDGAVTLTFNTVGITTKFGSGDSFKLYGDFTHGELSEQWPGEKWPFGVDPGENAEGSGPWVHYTFDPASGETVSGGNLKIELNIDPSGMVFVDMSEEEINSSSLGEVLAKVYTRTVWLSDQIAESGANSAGLVKDLPVIATQPTITVSGGKNEPTSFDALMKTSEMSDDNPDE